MWRSKFVDANSAVSIHSDSTVEGDQFDRVHWKQGIQGKEAKGHGMAMPFLEALMARLAY